MDKQLWLVKNDWNNHGAYEDSDYGTEIIGVFDDFDIAVEAVRTIYKKQVDETVVDNAFTAARDFESVPWMTVYLTDYSESLELDDPNKNISWTWEGEWDVEQFDYEYSFIPIEVNKAALW